MVEMSFDNLPPNIIEDFIYKDYVTQFPIACMSSVILWYAISIIEI